MSWLPADWQHPTRLDLETGHHLRPIRESDAEVDYPAVMGSRERLWERYGEAWGWPPATMTLEQDRDDLAHHEREIEAHESFLKEIGMPITFKELGAKTEDIPLMAAKCKKMGNTNCTGNAWPLSTEEIEEVYRIADR